MLSGWAMAIPPIAFMGYTGEVVEKYQWVSTKDFLDRIAMGQVTPGPIMVTTTFLGCKVASFWRTLLATIVIFSRRPSISVLPLARPESPFTFCAGYRPASSWLFASP